MDIFIIINYREEMFKQKRAFTGEGATNTPAGATNQGETSQAQIINQQ